MKKKILYSFFTLVFILGLGVVAVAGMGSENYRISTYVLSGGGADISSDSYKANFTLGQSTPLMDHTDPPFSANFDLYPGFWYTLANVNGGLGDELAVDFATYGLWHYDGSSWTSLAGWNPDGMVDWTGGLAVDFDTYGSWNYDGTTWTQLAGWNPEDGIAWNSDLAVDFGGNGLWHYDGSSWTSLASWNPDGMVEWTGGLAVNFGATYGLWNYDGSSWSNLAGWDSEEVIDVDLY